MYDGSKAAVRALHGMTKKMDTTVGVHRGSALSPFLFVLTLDCIVNHLEECPLRTIHYADDIALVADNREEMEEKVQLWQGALAGAKEPSQLRFPHVQPQATAGGNGM
ncbi:unnamed protein product [Heligmosomoides polygyrus]|uniref:Reverse transcriptase domain-containing protein n=1 Tax=Heligmosomoides polygyrus TaxID=6339 RepID=A0A183G169_HELPZ|nr:unnamed protein product [Heligmosomoides polygyrus]